MQRHFRFFLLPAALVCAVLGMSAAPSQPAVTQIVSTYLYASTLDWSTGTGSVYVYDAYGTNPNPISALAISPGFSEGLWTDAVGHVYVSVDNAGNNGLGYINVYTPGFKKLLRTYTKGLSGPSGGAFDSAGNMYVANLCGTSAVSCYVFAKTHRDINPQNGYVAVYPPGRLQPSKYLQGPLNIAVSVTVDRAGNVFVINNTGTANWNVVEFPLGSPNGHIVSFQEMPANLWVGALTMDPSGALVVSVSEGMIDFFPREHGDPSRTLTQGVVAADGLAYGPDGTLFAGNYEFKQNEGNTIAFPPGSNAPTRSYAVPYNNGVTSVTVGPSTVR